MIRVVVPAVTIVALVAAVSGLAAWNRAGAPLVTITLTERELALPFEGGPPDEPGVELRFVVEDGRGDALDALNWLPPATLTALGFDLSVPVGSPAAPRAYQRALPRPAWVVFEYDGAAWQALATRPEVAVRAERRSRLVAVDAGPALAPLVERYGDGRHVVLPALVGLSFVPPGLGGPMVHGVLGRLTPATLRVPPEMAGVLASLASRPTARRRVPAEPEAAQEPMAGAEEPQPPRYTVDLAVGRLGLPYIVAVKPVE